MEGVRTGREGSPTLQFRTLASSGELEQRSAHAVGSIRKRLIAMDEITSREHS